MKSEEYTYASDIIDFAMSSISAFEEEYLQSEINELIRTNRW